MHREWIDSGVRRQAAGEEIEAVGWAVTVGDRAAERSCIFCSFATGHHVRRGGDVMVLSGGIVHTSAHVGKQSLSSE